MKRIIFLLLVFSSCAGPKGSFQHYYNKQVKHAKIAISLPKWLPMLVVPRADKEEVKFFTEGMKRFKVLVYGKKNKESVSSFKSFANEKNYESYLEVRDGMDKVNVMSKETNGRFKEIILEFQSEEEHMIFAILGDMDKTTFYEAIKKARENTKD